MDCFISLSKSASVSVFISKILKCSNITVCDKFWDVLVTGGGWLWVVVDGCIL